LKVDEKDPEATGVSKAYTKAIGYGSGTKTPPPSSVKDP
jgi:hypothetical protein